MSTEPCSGRSSDAYEGEMVCRLLLACLSASVNLLGEVDALSLLVAVVPEKCRIWR